MRALIQYEKNCWSQDYITPQNYNPNYIYIAVPDNFTRKIYQVEAFPGDPYKSKGLLVNPWTYWSVEEKLNSIRQQRDFLIAQSDWRVIKATETNTPEDQAWKNYRQALRDFPNLVNVNLPIEQIVWPQPPS